MKPVLTIESYTQGLQICSMREFFFFAATVFVMHCVFFSIRAHSTRDGTK